MVTLARRRLQFASYSVLLDGAAAALATGCTGVLLLAPPLAGVTDGESNVVPTGLAYPVGDVLLVGLGVGLLAVRGARLGPTWLLILAGALVFAGTDTISLWQSVEGSYTPGGALDIGWMLGILLIGLPGLAPDRGAQGYRRGTPQRHASRRARRSEPRRADPSTTSTISPSPRSSPPRCRWRSSSSASS